MTTVAAPKDLRSYLAEVRAHDVPIARVSRRVSADRELAAIVKLLEAAGNPVVIFDNVDGLELPVIAGVCGTRERIALALHSTPERAVTDYLDRVSIPVAPVTGPGPVKDVCITGDDVDLAQLPVVAHAPADAGRFITAGVGLARDPISGAVNTGIYRMMVKDKRLLTVAASRGGDLDTIIKRTEAEGGELAFIVALGHHPGMLIASQAKLPIDVDSLAFTGAVLGEPLMMTAAETVDAAVPAYAELVLEGRIVRGARESDGRFGEYQYYYNRPYPSYVFEVSAITRRSDAFFLDLHNVHSEHRCLWIFPNREAELLAHVRRAVPGIRAVHIPLDSAGMHAYLAVDQARNGEGKQALLAALGGSVYIKLAVAVDTDVDIASHGEVMWAVATRSQADHDLIVVPGVAGPSGSPGTYSIQDRFALGDVTSNVGIDATRPVGVDALERADGVGEDYAALDLDEYVEWE
jgi:2,5-furandicarboxylate decarboxylase 1